MSRWLDVALIAALIAVVIGCFAAYAWVVQWAWNTLVPSVFGGPAIDYVQAIAVGFVLMVISGSGSRTVVRTRE